MRAKHSYTSIPRGVQKQSVGISCILLAEVRKRTQRGDIGIVLAACVSDKSATVHA